MADKEIKKLNRAELLEVLIKRTQENDALRAQLDAANAALEEASRELAKRSEGFPDQEWPQGSRSAQCPGNLAEEALRVSGILEAAQKSAAYYLKNIERMHAEQQQNCARIESEAREDAARLRSETTDQCREIKAEAQAYAAKLLKDAEQQCAKLEQRSRSEQLLETARQDAERNWENVNRRLDQLCEYNVELRQQLSEGMKKRKWYQ